MKLFKIFTKKMVKMNLFYERLPSNIILIKNTKLFFFFYLVGCVYIKNYGVMGPKSYNEAWAFGREHGSPSPRKNISSNQLKHSQI